MLKKYSYKLVCCNSYTGSNAFFIKNNFIELFNEVPREIEEIYVPPHYQLYERYGHPQSIKTIELIFEELEKMWVIFSTPSVFFQIESENRNLTKCEIEAYDETYDGLVTTGHFQQLSLEIEK